MAFIRPTLTTSKISELQQIKVTKQRINNYWVPMMHLIVFSNCSVHYYFPYIEKLTLIG